MSEYALHVIKGGAVKKGDLVLSTGVEGSIPMLVKIISTQRGPDRRDLIRLYAKPSSLWPLCVYKDDPVLVARPKKQRAPRKTKRA